MVDYIIIGVIVILCAYIIYRFIKKRGASCSSCSSCQECVYHKDGLCEIEKTNKSDEKNKKEDK